MYETNLFPFPISFLTFKEKENQSKIKQNPKSKNLLFFLTFLFYFMEPLTPSHQSWKHETPSLFLAAPVSNLSHGFYLSHGCHLRFLKPTQKHYRPVQLSSTFHLDPFHNLVVAYLPHIQTTLCNASTIKPQSSS